ncbi:MAG: acetyl-CoA carboxylase biotin carboxyl carrier protein subunit [Bdellovibrionales bacterium]|nr:acetyl-CoA carboxylase biotin carboxyl carrier protein subunit [Bdellovibrionales bacterium]
MLLFAKMNNKEYQLEVRESTPEWEVILTEIKTEKKEIHRLSKKDYQQFGEVISLIFNHRSYLIDIVIQGDDYTIFTKGSHQTIQLLTEERLLYNELVGIDSETRGNLIKAGMPGKIAEIHVKKEDIIKEGDLLLVIEAMKMENEIRSDRDGKVKKVYIKEGQNVETGAHLLSIDNL